MIFFFYYRRRSPAGREGIDIKEIPKNRMLDCFRVKRMKRKVTVTETTAGQRARRRIIRYRFFFCSRSLIFFLILNDS